MPVEVLRPLVPAPLAIDTYEGIAYVGLVPFWMSGVRPTWAPERTAFRFLETNVRTYVHGAGATPASTSSRWRRPRGWRWRSRGRTSGCRTTGRGCGCRATATVSTIGRGDCPADGPRSHGAVRDGRAPGCGGAGTLEHFLVERYVLHVGRRGRLWRGQVHHAPYPLQRARVLALHDELIGAAGLPQPTTRRRWSTTPAVSTSRSSR